MLFACLPCIEILEHLDCDTQVFHTFNTHGALKWNEIWSVETTEVLLPGTLHRKAIAIYLLNTRHHVNEN